MAHPGKWRDTVSQGPLFSPDLGRNKARTFFNSPSFSYFAVCGGAYAQPTVIRILAKVRFSPVEMARRTPGTQQAS